MKTCPHDDSKSFVRHHPSSDDDFLLVFQEGVKERAELKGSVVKEARRKGRAKIDTGSRMWEFLEEIEKGG